MNRSELDQQHIVGQQNRPWRIWDQKSSKNRPNCLTGDCAELDDVSLPPQASEIDKNERFSRQKSSNKCAEVCAGTRNRPGMSPPTFVGQQNRSQRLWDQKSSKIIKKSPNLVTFAGLTTILDCLTPYPDSQSARYVVVKVRSRMCTMKCFLSLRCARLHV